MGKKLLHTIGCDEIGRVYQHRDLLKWDEECPYGRGLWKIDEGY